mmetsp:Transcript_7767/g.9623  ORF Transcript_7767/g.9623 Transcript_7767/m.9623 type:complete len:107 (-) Transcript_7767:47-367(-)
MGKKEAKPENFTQSRQRFGLIGIFVICVIIDLIGSLSYIFPLFELTDIAWAPISAALTYQLFGNAFGSLFNLIEEALPVTDLIPTATIMFFYTCYQRGVFRSHKKD